MRRRVILVGRWYVIEPLGLMHLAGVAERAGWRPEVVLVKDGDFEPLLSLVAKDKPDLVAFSIWTGYHLKAFAAADRVIALGVPVAIGGPHATYFHRECEEHAQWVAKGDGFRAFRRILDGEASPGLVFDDERLGEGFPMPIREIVYCGHPHLEASPIKSMMCSVGCPFKCSYCYAPEYNRMYGGFALNTRPIDDLIREGQELRDRWPSTRLVYMQDDIFGYRVEWLAEFVRRWKSEVGLPWHCQIRLELTRNERRLDLFREGGCTGITLAIESGNDFLRRHVLLRPMSDELIVEGIAKIKNRGFTLRTEQILAVPFSDIETDLQTLELNGRLAPDMAWTSILAPYAGTAMGTIASNFGLYGGNNDDLTETFFDRSVLRHVAGGPGAVEDIATAASKNADDAPLVRLRAIDGRVVNETGDVLGTIDYCDVQANERYCDQTVDLQRLFYWFARVPQGYELARQFVGSPVECRTWARLGAMTHAHMGRIKGEEWTDRVLDRLIAAVGVRDETLYQNPYYFAYLPSGEELAASLVSDGTMDLPERERFDEVGHRTRRHLFDRALYKVVESTPPIAETIAV